jgi:hypothetical protein
MGFVGCKAIKIEGREYRVCDLTPKFKKFLKEVEKYYNIKLAEKELTKEGSRVILDDKTRCYFCRKKCKIVHHIDFNRNNNRFKNLLPLCLGCHRKLHFLINKLKKKKLRIS